MSLCTSLKPPKRLPGVAGVSDTLGYIYYKKDLAGLAISALKFSTEAEPENAIYHYHPDWLTTARATRRTPELIFA